MYKKISALLFLTIGQLGAASWSMVLPDNFSNELEELLIDIPQEPYSSTSASSSSGQSDGQAEKKAMPKRVRFKYDILPDVSGTKPFPSDGAATAYTLAEFHEAKDQEDLAEKMESLRSTRRAQRCTNRMQGNIEKRLIELGRSSGVSTTQEIDAILGKNVPRKMRIDVAKEMNRAVGRCFELTSSFLLSRKWWAHNAS